MNRILLLFTACLLVLSFQSHAQITLDAGDAPAIGDEYIYSVDTTVAGLTAGPAGENLTWVFSGMETHSVDTTTVVDPLTVPGNETFPDATVALETMGFFAFAQLTSTELLNLGAIGDALGLGQPFIVVFDPPEKILEVPTTFGTAFTDNYRFQLELAGEDVGFADFDSIRYVSNVTKDVAVDGWGTIEINGESHDALRQHTVTTSTDSISFQLFGNWIPLTTLNNTSEDYQWLSKDAKGPVFTLDFDDAGVPVSATFLGTGVTAVAPVAAFSYEDLGSGAFAFSDESTNTPASWLWDFDDGNTSDAQNPEHTFSEEGTYNVCLTATNSAGSDQTCQEVQVIITATGEPTLNDQLLVTPNPATDLVQFRLDSYQGQRLRLTVVDLHGQSVFRQSLDGNLTVHTSQWAAGPYFYVLQDTKGYILAAGKLEIYR